MSASPSRAAPPNWRRPVILLPALALATVVLLVLALLVGLQLAYADRVYPGVGLFGTDLGGSERHDARAAVERRAAEVLDRPLALRYGEQVWTPSAAELGLRVEVGPTLDAVFAAGREGNLLEQLSSRVHLLISGIDLDELAVEIDQAAQDRYLEQVAGDVDRPPADARMTVFSDGRIEYDPAEPGLRLDLLETQAHIQTALLDPSVASVELAVEETLPVQTDAHLAEARATVENILASPMVAISGDRQWTLDVTQLWDLLEFEGVEGEPLRVWLDRERLHEWVAEVAREADEPAQNARFAWDDGDLELIRPSRDGFELNVEAAIEAVERQAPTDQREIVLPMRTTHPMVREDMRDQLAADIQELVEEARTSFAGSVPAKRHNIELAAERLNGVVVPPGETFSFNQELGPTTLDAGWQVGWGILTLDEQTRTVPSVAGGICQVSTTLFHAVFWAGYQVEERNWHRYWIPAYTSKGVEGLDATVDEDAGLDFRFANTTDRYLLIQSWVDAEDGINFALYGTTPDWEVVVEPPDKRDIQPAEQAPVEEFEPGMPEGERVQVESARDGFNITIERLVIQDDDVRTLELNSRYVPSRNVTVVGTGGRPAPQSAEALPLNQPTRQTADEEADD